MARWLSFATLLGAPMPFAAIFLTGAAEMNGPSVADLCQTFVDSLGVPASIVDHRAMQLRKAGVLPTGKGGRNGAGAARVGPEHAASLLIAILAGDPAPVVGQGGGVAAAHAYGALPLESVCVVIPNASGEVTLNQVDDESEIYSFVRNTGSTFGPFLTAIIHEFNQTSVVNFIPTDLRLDGGPGTLRASVMFSCPVFPSPHFRWTVYFDMTGLGAGLPPDDAAPARLERAVVIGGAVFEALRVLFGGGAVAALPELASPVMEPEIEDYARADF